MIIFWIIIIIIGILILVDKFILKGKSMFSEIINFLVVLQIVFFILAITTNDPLLPPSFGVDPWWELTIEGIIVSFTVWKTYLNPLKRKVYSMDREIGEVKSTVSSIKSDISLIKEKIINGKIRG